MNHGLQSIIGQTIDVTDYLRVDGPLACETIVVHPGGFLDIYPGADITFVDTPIDLDADPEQMSHGLVVHGKLRVNGTPKTPFERITAELFASSAAIYLDVPDDWEVGDRIYIPDTRQPDYPQTPTSRPMQDEYRTIANITDDAIILDKPLAYDHRGAKDADGKLLFFPVIANLTRDIVFRSENCCGTRAHCIFMHQADVEFRYALLQDLGRTTNAPLDPVKNHIARYPLHCHHLMGPPPGVRNTHQFILQGNVVHSENPVNRWGITVHQSHHGYIGHNVVVSCAGSGIVTEDGNESRNTFELNYVANVTGDGRPDGRQNEIGFEGACYWFRGGNNVVSYNHAYGAQIGYTHYARFAKTYQYPSVPGGELDTPMDPVTVPIREFEGNECVGCQTGFAPWWIGVHDRTPVDGIGKSVIKDFTAWHCRSGVSAYECGRFAYDNLTLVGDFKFRNDSNGGWGCSDYVQWQCEIRGGRIENYRSGIRTPAIADRIAATGTNPGLFVVAGTSVRCLYNITIPTPWHNANAKDLPPLTIHLDKPKLLPLTKETRHINYALTPAEFLNYPQWICVGVLWGPIRLRWFGPQQEPDEMLPATSQGGRVQGAPTAQKNVDAWRMYGLANGGEIVPDGQVMTSPDNDGCAIFVKDAPYIRPIPDVTLQPGQSWTYGVCCYNPNLRDVEYSLTGPEGMTIDKAGKITWTAAKGIHVVLVGAKDESGRVGEREFKVWV